MYICCEPDIKLCQLIGELNRLALDRVKSISANWHSQEVKG